MRFDIQQAACFYYLKEIQSHSQQNQLHLSNEKPYNKLKAVLEEIDDLKNYDFNNQSYAQLYSKFQSSIEKVAKFELKNNKLRSNPSPLDELFLKIYENDSKINKKLLEHLYGHKNLPFTEEEINLALKQFSANTDKSSLSHPDNRLNAFFTSMLGFNYHPLKKNNIPYMNPEATSSSGAKNLRFGSQTHGSDTVNATFQRYLLANARRAHNEQPYNYVYINLLKRKQSEQTIKKKDIIKKLQDKFVRSSEGARASSLEVLNLIKDLKVAVITLPADNDFLLAKFSMRTGKEQLNTHNVQSLDGIFNDLAMSVQQNKNDFYMPKKVKTLLFGENFLTATPEALFNAKFGELFKQSVFDVTGKKISSLNELAHLDVSPKTRNAILFHFIKSQLTSHIVDTLKPSGFNTSCKDGIDRGAIHTFWYEINERYKAGKPLSKEAFLQYLDAPAMIVKYRALNHNRNLIWNLLDHRCKADPAFAMAHPYVREWLTLNNPSKEDKHEHRHTFVSSKIKSLAKHAKDEVRTIAKKAKDEIESSTPKFKKH